MPKYTAHPDDIRCVGTWIIQGTVLSVRPSLPRNDSRPRFQGTADDIYAALKPIVDAKGISFLVFQENSVVADAVVNEEEIEKAHDVATALKK